MIALPDKSLLGEAPVGRQTGRKYRRTERINLRQYIHVITTPIFKTRPSFDFDGFQAHKEPGRVNGRIQQTGTSTKKNAIHMQPKAENLFRI